MCCNHYVYQFIIINQIKENNVVLCWSILSDNIAVTYMDG